MHPGAKHRQPFIEPLSDFIVGNIRRLGNTVTLTLECEKRGDINRHEAQVVEGQLE